MTHDSDFFTPDTVDEQVDQLSSNAMRDHVSPAKRAEVLLVQDLKAYYQSTQREEHASLERAWKRVSARLPGDRDQTQAQTEPLSKLSRSNVPQGRKPIMLMRNNAPVEISRRKKFSRQLSLLVAALVAVVLVGSLLVIVNQKQQTGSFSPSALHVTPKQQQPTPTATSGVVPGQTLYTTPSNRWGFDALSWSPDSQRIAASTVDSVQFWDAKNGGHLVTVQLPYGNEWADNLAWSPKSQTVAIATNLQMLLVDGRTGKILSQQAPKAQTARSTTTTGRAVFSNLAPASGGYGYRATAWSPDARLIASALSFGPNGEVEVWNPQTGTTAFTLTVGSSENVGALSWSSDGRYIAANIWNTQGIYSSQPGSKIMVWDASTHQVIFQHGGTFSSNDPVAWQPQTSNLAFFGDVSSAGKTVSALEVWNVITNKQIGQYFSVSQALAWSPDGKYLAYYAGTDHKSVSTIAIMDVSTGEQTYAYKEHHLPISVITWSPDGKYIASAEGLTQGDMVAKVWTA